jgi:Uma2 family endonuclease
LLKNKIEMTAIIAQPKTLTFKEFLELEAKSAVKHEFHRGKIKEMAGGTQRHSALAQNVGFYLKGCTKRKS